MNVQVVFEDREDSVHKAAQDEAKNPGEPLYAI